METQQLKTEFPLGASALLDPTDQVTPSYAYSTGWVCLLQLMSTMEIYLPDETAFNTTEGYFGPLDLPYRFLEFHESGLVSGVTQRIVTARVLTVSALTTRRHFQPVRFGSIQQDVNNPDPYYHVLFQKGFGIEQFPLVQTA